LATTDSDQHLAGGFPQKLAIREFFELLTCVVTLP
jgi:hypothetical protein